jgi:hypothetical protein
MKKLAAILFCIMLVTNCSRIAGTSDETSTGTRTARVLYSDLTPAAGIEVQIFAAGDTSRIPLDEVKTGTNGEYSFTIKNGYYTLWAEKDSLTAYKDSVLFTSSGSDSSTLILEKSGSISGYVRLQPGDNPVSVYIGVLGTYKYCNVDQQGKFTLTGLALGEYTLRLVSNLDHYTPTFVSVNCISDSLLVLKDTIDLVYSGIPAVNGITAQFDSITGTSRISWNKSSYIYLDRYIVYRRLSSDPYNGNETIGMTTDTTFTDSTASFFGKGSAVRYSVAILSKTGATGNAYLSTDINTCVSESLLVLTSPQNGSSVSAGNPVMLSWSKVMGAAGYQLHISTDKSFSDTVSLMSQADTQITVKSLSVGSYFWRVRAKNINNEFGSWSERGMFGVGVFVKKLGVVNEFSGGMKMAGLKDGAVILNSKTGEKTCDITKIDSLGNQLWKKSITAGYTSLYAQRITVADNGIIAVVDYYNENLDSSLIVKYSFFGEEVWRKKTERVRSLQVSRVSRNIVLGEPLKIVVLDPNGNQLNEYQPVNDSLKFVFPVNDTMMICVFYNVSSGSIKQYNTSSKSLLHLSSLQVNPVSIINSINGFLQNDGTVHVIVNISTACYGTSVEYHINNQGIIDKSDFKTDGLFGDISRNGNNVAILIIDGMKGHMSINLFNESFDDCRVIDLYSLSAGSYSGCVIQGDSNLLVVMQSAIAWDAPVQTYILGFPVNGRPLLPPELLDK